MWSMKIELKTNIIHLIQILFYNQKLIIFEELFYLFKTHFFLKKLLLVLSWLLKSYRFDTSYKYKAQK